MRPQVEDRRGHIGMHTQIRIAKGNEEMSCGLTSLRLSCSVIGPQPGLEGPHRPCVPLICTTLFVFQTSEVTIDTEGN